MPNNLMEPGDVGADNILSNNRVKFSELWSKRSLSTTIQTNNLANKMMFLYSLVHLVSVFF